MKNALLIFIKNPELGKVKTRLAAEIGDEMALRVYHKLTDYTRAVCSATSADRLVFYSSHIDPEDAWGAGLFKKQVQSGNDLGARMSEAFRSVLEEKGYEKAIIIGSDCAEITPELLQEAFDRLDHSDLVIGPALDGGYYLLGMKKHHGYVFSEIDWSTESVAAQTLERAAQLGLSIEKLKVLRDIDQLDDLKAVGWW